MSPSSLRATAIFLPLLAALSACSSEPSAPPASGPNAGTPAAGGPGGPGGPGPQGGQPIAPSLVDPIAVSSGQVDMIALKNDTADVPGRFEGVTGSIRLDPDHLAASNGSLTIDLSSWHSDEDIRDGRLKTTFFDVAHNPTASFDLTEIQKISGQLTAVGDSATGQATGMLHWRAVNQHVEAPVQVTRTADQAYTVKVDSFDISIAGLEMSEPLKALITECQHKSIGDTIKVSLSLALGDQPGAQATPADDGSPAAAPTKAEGERTLRQEPRQLDKSQPVQQGRPLKRADGDK